MIERHDVKLQLDVECQEIASEVVLSAFPDHLVLGEEDPVDLSGCKGMNERDRDESPYEWIIDPIDGTVNFFHGNPFWCCSVAVRYRGMMQAGSIYAPVMRWSFEATIDEAARWNGEILKVSDTTELQRANIHTGADKSEGRGERPFRFFHRIAEVAQRARICGSAALDICLVAAGAADAYFEPGLFLWDVAAADLILKQAGGSSSLLREWPGHKLAYLGTNGKLHELLKTELEPLF